MVIVLRSSRIVVKAVGEVWLLGPAGRRLTQLISGDDAYAPRMGRPCGVRTHITLFIITPTRAGNLYLLLIAAVTAATSAAAATATATNATAPSTTPPLQLPPLPPPPPPIPAQLRFNSIQDLLF